MSMLKFRQDNDWADFDGKVAHRRTLETDFAGQSAFRRL